MSRKKKGKRYQEDFKDQIVDLYHCGQSVDKLSKEYHISTVTIYKWIKERKVVTLPSGNTMTAKEMERLKKENQELRKENEILKKAAAIFAKMD